MNYASQMVILDDDGQQSTLHINGEPGADTLRIISLKWHGQLQQRDSARKHQQRRDRAAFRARTKVRTKKFGIRLKMNPELGRLIPPRGPLSAEQSAATLRAASGFQKEFNGTHVMIDLRHS